MKEIAQDEPIEACRRLTGLVNTQNQLALDPERRLQLLEIVRPAMRAPLDALAARVQAQSVPLPLRTREVAQLHRELLQAMIAGYETVAAADHQRSTRATALVVQRLLATRGELLLRHIEAQEPLPATFWQRANANYGQAEAAGAARRRVTDKHWHGSRRPTPADAFVSLLLLALAHPRDLRPGEAARIHRATQNWCRDARLQDARRAPADAAARGSVFAVALDAVTAPVQWRQRAGEARPQERVLDVARVVKRVERLHAHAAAINRPPGDDAIGPTGLKRLLDNWNPRPLRRQPDGAAGHPAEVLIGLEAIHQRLERGGSVRAKRTQKRTRHYTQLRENVLQTISQDESGSAAYPHARATVEHPGIDAAKRDDEVTGGSDIGSEWLLEEADASGFRLRWRGQDRSGATVGELVAFRVDGNADAALAQGAECRWRVGVVRWLQFVEEDCFAIGCELLSPRPRPARLHHEPVDRHRRSSPRGEGEPTLLLPEAEDREATALALPYRFDTMNILELDAGERTVRVQLTTMREQSLYFTQFTLAPAPARGRTSGMPVAPARSHSIAG